MKCAANRLVRREGHEAAKEAVNENMQTYSIEAAQHDLSKIAHLAARGQDIVLTENDSPLVRLVPVSFDEVHRRKVQNLEGFLKGMDTDLGDRGSDRL